MKFVKNVLAALRRRGPNVAAAAAIAGTMALLPEAAMAQDPFARATTGAAQFRDSLASFALVVGGIGMVACLLLGFFGKLNWKWVATGVGVSFAIVIVPGAVNWLAGLAGGA